MFFQQHQRNIKYTLEILKEELLKQLLVKTKIVKQLKPPNNYSSTIQNFSNLACKQHFYIYKVLTL